VLSCSSFLTLDPTLPAEGERKFHQATKRRHRRFLDDTTNQASCYPVLRFSAVHFCIVIFPHTHTRTLAAYVYVIWPGCSSVQVHLAETAVYVDGPPPRKMQQGIWPFSWLLFSPSLFSFFFLFSKKNNNSGKVSVLQFPFCVAYF